MINSYSIASFTMFSITSALSIFVLMHWRRGNVVRLYGIYTALLSAWSFCWFKETSSQDGYFWCRILHIPAAFIPALFLHFVQCLSGMESDRKLIFVRRALYLGGIAFSSLSFNEYFILSIPPTPKFYSYLAPGPLYIPFIILFFTGTLITLFMLVKGLKVSKGFKKVQLKLVFWAYAIGYLGGTMVFLPEYGYSFPAYSLYAVPLCHIIIAYAIIRYKLMDINLLFRYATVYSIFALLLGLPLCILVCWIQSQVLSSTMILCAILLSPYLFIKLRSGLTAAVDHLPIFKGRYERLNGLKKYQQAIAQSQTLEEWESRVVNAIRELFNPEGASVLLYDESINGYKTKSYYLFLNLQDPIVVRLVKDKSLLIREFLNRVSNERQDKVVSRMKSIQSELCLPLFIGGHLISILMVGSKMDKEMYNDLDLSALWGLGRVAEEALRGILTRDELIKKERLEAMGQLASVMSHEMRNALVAISNSAYFLENKVSDDKGLKHVHIIRSQISSGYKILSDMLEYVRNGDLVLEMGSVNDLISEVTDLMDIPSNIGLVLDLSEEIPRSMFDKEELSRAFTNLLQNAIQAMPDGGSLRIESKLEVGEQIQVKVSDTGHGIPKENLDKIFQPFFTTKRRGTGLGMVVIKRVIERHQGTIHVESSVEEGTTFTIHFPLRLSQPEKTDKNAPSVTRKIKVIEKIPE